MRFIEQWMEAWHRQADAVVLRGPQGALRGHEALERARHFAAALVGHRLQAGETVAFYGTADADWPWLLLGVLRAGANFALLPATQDDQILARLLQQAKPRYVFCAGEAEADRAVRAMKAVPGIVQLILQHGRIRNPAVVSLEMLSRSAEPILADKPIEVAQREIAQTDEDAAAILFSAGSLSLPRAVRASHGRLAEQAQAVAGRLGTGPMLHFGGRLELVDHSALLWAAVCAGRAVSIGSAFPDEPFEWVATAGEASDRLFAETWPVLGPNPLPRGFSGLLLQRRVARRLRAAWPGLRGLHTGFSVPVEPIRRQVRRAGLRLTWGYGLVEAFGFCTWEEAGAGFGSVLPHIQLGTRQGNLAFDWSSRATAWWQATGDWARSLGPWIADLEPHGAERGEAAALHAARRMEEEIAAHPFVATAFVSGPEPMNHVALLSLREPVVRAWGRAAGLGEDFDTLCARPELTEPLLARARAIGRRHGVALRPRIPAQPLSSASGEQTARGEFRRSLIARRALDAGETVRPAPAEPGGAGVEE